MTIEEYLAYEKDMQYKSATEKDWTEDFTHENGDYFNQCCECKETFRGHKRRVVCRKCTLEYLEKINGSDS